MNFDGSPSIGPQPFAAVTAQINMPTPVRMRNGALHTSSHLMLSMPRRMIAMFSAQNSRKQNSSPGEMPSTGRLIFVAGLKPKMTALVA